MSHDQKEINKFNDLAYKWWDTDGEFKTLHQVNPIRLDYVKRHTNLEQKLVLDVGCGGGIFSEALASSGAQVTGIDLAPQSIEIAKLHLFESNLTVNYECISIEEKANSMPNHFDIITCLEMLEHVPDPEIIIANCATLLKPNGIAIFSTLNRTLKSYLLGVLAAEYILNIIPKNTHDYKKFIKPNELNNILKRHSLELFDIKGIDYNPLNSVSKITNNIDINYILTCRKYD